MRITSIIVTTLFAGAAGAIAGTLFAPGKGSKTRSRIARKGEQYKDYLYDNIEDFTDSVSHPFENLKEETKRLGKKKAKAKAEEIKARANNNS